MSKKQQARGRGRPKSPDGKPVTISANVPPALVEDIDAVAEAEERSRSQAITILLKEALRARGLLK